MAITVKRETVSFSVEHDDPLIEIALAMAELNRRWGYRGAPEVLEASLNRVIRSAQMDPKVKIADLALMKSSSKRIRLMEELAASFRVSEDEGREQGQLPRFQGELDEALETAQSYAQSLGCELTPDY